MLNKCALDVPNIATLREHSANIPGILHSGLGGYSSRIQLFQSKVEFSYFNHGTIIVPCFNLVLFFRVCRSTGIFHAFDFQKQSNRKTPFSDLELYKKVAPTQALSCEFCKIEFCTPLEDCFSFFDDYKSFYFIQMT